MGSVQEYLAAMSKNRGTVHDPFSHAQSLLRTEEDISFEKKYYGKIVNAKAILSNIENDHLMFYIQIDVGILTGAYELACREVEFRPVFEYMYNSWVGQLSMTRAMRGKERSLQATPGGGYNPQGDFSGYGQEFGQQTPEEQGGNPLSNALGKIGIRKPQTGAPEQRY